MLVAVYSTVFPPPSKPASIRFPHGSVNDQGMTLVKSRRRPSGLYLSRSRPEIATSVLYVAAVTTDDGRAIEAEQSPAKRAIAEVNKLLLPDPVTRAGEKDGQTLNVPTDEGGSEKESLQNIRCVDPLDFPYFFEGISGKGILRRRIELGKG